LIRFRSPIHSLYEPTNKQEPSTVKMCTPVFTKVIVKRFPLFEGINSQSHQKLDKLLGKRLAPLGCEVFARNATATDSARYGDGLTIEVERRLSVEQHLLLTKAEFLVHGCHCNDTVNLVRPPGIAAPTLLFNGTKPGVRQKKRPRGAHPLQYLETAKEKGNGKTQVQKP
jgi:hypothetical protein